ncbi:MAG: acetolactate synthase large subunit [Methanobacteriota archaeon]|nr:MAG: acetolactate synthase large subunit [Euryarchaeota archaeon]
MRGAKAILESLKREKVEVMFGIPGGAVIPLYDELYGSDIRTILMRHEQAAAHAADGYARASGEVGVCVATSGPGATNLVTGIASAYLDSSPVVAFTGQVPRPMIGKDAFQETDPVGITMPVTKHNFQFYSVEEIPYIIKKAFKIARTGRPGPVLIDVPKDVQEKEGVMKFPKDVDIIGYNPTVKGHPKQIKKAVELLLKAERPIALVGGGVIISGASKELLELVELMQLPVVTSLMGKGAFPEDHPLALGMIGMHGRKAGNFAISDADVILAVGCRFSDRTTGNVNCFAPEAKVIHIDIEPAEIGKNVPVEVPVVGDARQVLKEMLALARTKVKKHPAWLEKIKRYKKEFQPKMDYDDVPLMPQRVIKEIMEVLKEEDIVVTEVGQCQMWAAHFLSRTRSRTFISSGGLGTMGFGFPASIGAKMARPDRNVIDIAGDGSFMMNCQELATTVVEDIPVVVGVMNNHYLGMVRQWQELFFDRRYSGVYLGEVPDYLKLAEAFGAEGIRVEKPGEIKDAVKEAFSCGKPTVIDFVVKPESNIFPMVPPGGCLKDIIEG